tara:strand:+ start:116 stop:730 length:615 start_codon:yes stop_codon:yes gene_type:complete
MVNKKEVKKRAPKKVEKTPAVEPIKEQPKVEVATPTLDDVQANIIRSVVEKLSPEMNKAIENKFEEMKNVISKNLEAIQPQQQSEPEPVMEQQQPDLTVPQQQEKAGLEALAPIIQLLGMGNNNNQQQGSNGMMNMFMETMLRQSMANLTRNDSMQEMMMKAAYKKILGEDVPSNVMKTTNELMNPLKNYGDKAEAAREAAKNL